MNLLQGILLGILQGLTEFIPVSSSGHLVLLPNILGWEQQSLAFDAVLHLGTACALVLYFFKDIVEIIKSNRDLGLKILAGSVPAGIIGFLFEDYFETIFRGPISVAIFLIAGSLLMLGAEFFSRFPIKTEFTYKRSFIIGLFQSLALFPGVSRSGATISGGLFMGIRHKDAARFSFLLSIPVVMGAGLYKLVTLDQISDPISMVGGFTASFISGLLAIKFMLYFLKNNRLYTFIAYRIIAALLILSFII